MRHLTSGEAPDAQIGGFLVALRAKGVTSSELAAFAQVLRERAAALTHEHKDLVDTCGTGGGRPSFNISTAAAIVAASAGARIAKHGNRGVTSACGSADVLEALEVNIQLPIERQTQVLNEAGIVFMFAPAHHPAMRHVGPARKALGLRTVFNQLGPLANPAGARRQLIGVYEQAMVRPMAEALVRLGVERALVVHGEDGLDEISPSKPTRYAKVVGGQLTEGRWTPGDFGLKELSEAHLDPGESVAANAAILREAISVASSPRSAAVLPSAAAALWLAGLVEDLPRGARMAREAIATGAAARKLQQLAGLTKL